MRFVHGDPLMIDYTAGTAVTAGDIVQYLGKACIAHTDIPAGALGAVAYPNGSAVYAIEDEAWQTGEDTVVANATVYVQTADGKLSDTSTGALAVGIPFNAITGAAIDAEGTLIVHGG